MGGSTIEPMGAGVATMIRIKRRAPSIVVYVDDAIHPRNGHLVCHMFSLHSDALHALAERIGVPREWFQQPPQASWYYYDLIYRKRAQAIAAGAVLVDHFKTFEISKKQQGLWTEQLAADTEKARARRADTRRRYDEQRAQ
jgi:hypothetical protein